MIAPGECLIACRSGDDHFPVALRWNAMDRPPASLDIVLHLHGYSASGPALDIVTEKLPLSGLDFIDPDRSDGAPAVTRPTLGLLPRGRWFGGRTGHGFDFPHLIQPGAVEAVLADAVAAWEAQTSCASPATGERILTAHSGGGAAVAPLLGLFQPDRILVFDALYAPAPDLARWVETAIASADPRKSLRVAYIAGTATEAHSIELARRIDALLAGARVADGLEARFKVEAVSVDHGDIARRLGWRWLADPVAKDEARSG